MGKLLANLKHIILSMAVVAGSSTAAFAQDTEAAQDAAAVPKAVGEVVSSQIDTAKKLVDMAIEFIVKYGFQVVGGIIVLILGWTVAKYISKFVMNFLNKQGLDVTVTKFLVGAVKLIIMAFAILIALGKFGIEIAPFIAGISVIGFGTSFALQGPLSNYAAGIALVFTKPFKVGDIIEVSGVMGEVEDMALPRTILRTVDGTAIMVPNNQIIGEIIHNYTTLKRLNITIGISYDSDVDRAIEIINEIVKSEPRIDQKRISKTGISEFADSSINIYSRLWCKQSDYWEVMFNINRSIFAEFKKNGIVIPFPQRDVHIIGSNAEASRLK